LSVILNFYGGSFAVGSSNDYGPAYLLEKNLILVSCNYRYLNKNWLQNNTVIVIIFFIFWVELEF
jgi:carboxylesterase type B